MCNDVVVFVDDGNARNVFLGDVICNDVSGS